MDVHIIVATKGRPNECYRLLDLLATQTLSPTSVTFVGVDDSDTTGLSEHPSFEVLGGHVLFAKKAGLPVQRNAGVEHILDRFAGDRESFCVFFDDDFRPDENWLSNAEQVFQDNEEVVALTGQVLADGIKGAGISEGDASLFLSGELAPEKCWAQGDRPRAVDSLYGCNMAVRSLIFSKARFDERLPLYAWQEDRDFTSAARSFGRAIYHPSPRGVHLGAKSARNSGLKMGYSQIANMVYLRAKGSVSTRVCAKFLAKALLANTVKSVAQHPYIDYRGRLLGNMVAISDAARGRLQPERILSLK